MLVNFFIDPDAIDNATNAYHINALRNKWQQYGVLSHPSHDDGGFRNIRRKFPELNQGIQRIWARVWREIENDPTRYLRCREDFKVALISELRARNEQIPNGDSRYVRGVEAIRLTEVNDSEEFKCSEDLSKRRIEIGESLADLWQERFRQLARYARDIVIVDSWAVRAENIQGLVRCLNLLDTDSNGCDVKIYSSPETELQKDVQSISEELGNLTSHIDGYGINSIEVRLRPEDDFRLYAHDRHIRFDNRVIGIGRGLRIFEFDSVREATRPSFDVLPEGESEETEDDLDRKAYKIADFCLLIGTPAP